MRVACSTGCVLAFKLMVLLQLQALPAQDHRRVVGHVQRGLQQEPAGSAGALADFVGQRIYFTNGNAPCPLGSQPIVDAMSCIEGADETIDVPSVCGGTLLSECVQRRNESLLPKGCFTLEYLGVVSLVLNPGGGETLTCQQPAFCDNICVKLPPEPPTTTLPVTVTHSTMTYTAPTSYQLSTAAPLGKQVPSTTVTTTTVTTTALSDGEDSDAISSTGDQINADSDDSDATPRGDQTEHGHQPQVKTSPSNSPRVTNLMPEAPRRSLPRLSVVIKLSEDTVANNACLHRKYRV
ncbi:hypothetical protein AK812_SmicGene10306 [Symbiodinium microadriaticum]|uniref:Uncharacterized protein n=1 Tax=Symbiodinium microadriaticum TaxID=2951 RepID=A0A1Q9EG99_SYMMI|nr:hypothetical protein AK812_SmicGene10306 [Symbiodinium microadriaticum]